MDIKEQIHGLTEEMLTNLGRLVAIDSQLGTPADGKPFGEGPAKALEEGLKIAQELGFKTVNLDNYCGYSGVYSKFSLCYTINQMPGACTSTDGKQDIARETQRH